MSEIHKLHERTNTKDTNEIQIYIKHTINATQLRYRCIEHITHRNTKGIHASHNTNNKPNNN